MYDHQQNAHFKKCSDVDSPRFVIRVAFQTNRYDNNTNDPKIFNNLNITHICLTINSDYCPAVRSKLTFSKGDYGEAYLVYVNSMQVMPTKTIYFSISTPSKHTDYLLSIVRN